MLTQIDLETVIATNPKVDVEALKKGQEALKDLYRSGVVQRSTYELDTPESQKDLRHNISSNLVTDFRRSSK